MYQQDDWQRDADAAERRAEPTEQSLMSQHGDTRRVCVSGVDGLASRSKCADQFPHSLCIACGCWVSGQRLRFGLRL